MVGVVIAAVTLLPEGVSAVRAAWANRPQTSLNLALGSALSSIGLTIPVVAAVSLVYDLPLALGLDPEHVDAAGADAVRLDADPRHRTDHGAAGRGASGDPRRVPDLRRDALTGTKRRITLIHGSSD